MNLHPMLMLGLLTHMMNRYYVHCLLLSLRQINLQIVHQTCVQYQLPHLYTGCVCVFWLLGSDQLWLLCLAQISMVSALIVQYARHFTVYSPLLDRAKHTNSPLYLLTVDVDKAYDSVCRARLFELCTYMGIADCALFRLMWYATTAGGIHVTG